MSHVVRLARVEYHGLWIKWCDRESRRLVADRVRDPGAWERVRGRLFRHMDALRELQRDDA